MSVIALLVLAVIAFFLVKYVIGKSSQQDSSATAAQTQEALPFSEKSTAAIVQETAKSSLSSVNMSNSLSNLALDTGDLQNDVQEMIKILNLAPSDASRLSISREAFSALLKGNTANAPSADQLSVAATKLRNMLA